MNDFKILPSILAADHGQFLTDIATVDTPEIELLHVDVMDGHFVPNITFGPKVVASLRKHTRFALDVHLMISNPDQYVPAFAEAGADIITVHQEACPHLHRSVHLIKEQGVKAGVALNPATSLESVRHMLPDIDLLLIMTVNPGFGGQKFISNVLQKIEQAERLRRDNKFQYVIEVDGGVDTETAPKVYEAGARFLVAGSAIFRQEDRPAAIRGISNSITTFLDKQKTIHT